MRNSALAHFRTVVTIIIAIASTVALAQEGESGAGQPLTRVSFELFHSRVYLPVEVNGRKTLEMVLDTGAAVSGLNQTSAEAIQLRTAGEAQLNGNGESRLKIAIAKDVTFRVGTVELLEKSVAIIPHEDMEAHEGRPMAGVLGINLFRRYVVVVDYASRTLSLYDAHDFVYHGTGERIPLRMGAAALFRATIEVAGREPLSCDLAVDSGAYSALRLYRPYLEKHHLLDLHTPVTDSFGFGLGGEFPEKLGRVDRLRIGSLELKQPVTSFSDARSGATSGGDYDGTIGGTVLERFRVIFDYPHRQIILEPNSSFSTAWPADTSGMILRASGGDMKTISVLHILRNTPAARAGIKEGDVIVSVNAQDTSSLGLEGLRRLFTNSGRYDLQLRRGQQIQEIDLRTVGPLF